jgi:hypothetical protein
MVMCAFTPGKKLCLLPMVFSHSLIETCYEFIDAGSLTISNSKLINDNHNVSCGLFFRQTSEFIDYP